MISNFEQVHNYYERLVFEEVLRRSSALDYGFRLVSERSSHGKP